MSEQLAVWIAQEAVADERRLFMALVGVGLVVVWECLRRWPEEWRRVGRLAFVAMGGVSYAAIFALGLSALAHLVVHGR